MKPTHEVVDIDTGKIICTLPFSGGQLPTYRAYIRPITHHDWKCISPGVYDCQYKCKKCGKVLMESADDPTSARPESGCR